LAVNGFHARQRWILERELTVLRQMGGVRRDSPQIAARLQIEQDRCEDPHVERMIEAFAFLAGASTSDRR